MAKGRRALSSYFPAGLTGEKPGRRPLQVNPDMAWLYRDQETLEREYMESRRIAPPLARAMRPHLACIFCSFNHREKLATAWVPLSPEFPDPAAPACSECWSKAFYVMLIRDRNIYNL